MENKQLTNEWSFYKVVHHLHLAWQCICNSRLHNPHNGVIKWKLGSTFERGKIDYKIIELILMHFNLELILDV